MTIIINIDHNQ